MGESEGSASRRTRPSAKSRTHAQRDRQVTSRASERKLEGLRCTPRCYVIPDVGDHSSTESLVRAEGLLVAVFEGRVSDARRQRGLRTHTTLNERSMGPS